MSDLSELYQDLILDHNKRPRNRGELPTANHRAEGYNPLCGDRVTVMLRVEDGVVKEVAFQGSGCAISTASSSLMTDVVKGKTVEEAQALFERFHKLVTGEPAAWESGPEMGKLKVFSGVSRFPARVKCATLAWHTVAAALENKDEPVSTE